jgi:hypothetical protein
MVKNHKVINCQRQMKKIEGLKIFNMCITVKS